MAFCIESGLYRSRIIRISYRTTDVQCRTSAYSRSDLQNMLLSNHLSLGISGPTSATQRFRTTVNPNNFSIFGLCICLITLGTTTFTSFLTFLMGCESIYSCLNIIPGFHDRIMCTASFAGRAADWKYMIYPA